MGQRAQCKSCHLTWLSLLSFLAPVAEAKGWMSTGDESCFESLQIRTEPCWKSNVRCLHTSFLHSLANEGNYEPVGLRGLFYHSGILANGLRKWSGIKIIFQEEELLEKIGLSPWFLVHRQFLVLEDLQKIHVRYFILALVWLASHVSPYFERAFKPLLTFIAYLTNFPSMAFHLQT